MPEPSARLWWTAFAVVAVLLLLPLTVVDVPPLLDYPNHLARLYVLAHPDDPVLARFYAQNWSIMPNLAIDVLFPPLLHVLPVHVAGRIVIGVALLLPVLGCAAFSRAAFCRRSLWPLASGLVVYNAPFFLGFLNFQITLGLALLAAAGWQAWAHRWPVQATVVGAACAVALFFGHIFGLAFFGVLVGAGELAALRGIHAPMLAHCARRGSMLVAMFCIPAALYLHASLGASNSGWFIVQPWLGKLFVAFSPFAHHRLGVAGVTAAAVLLAVGILALSARLRAGGGALLAMAVLSAAYLLTPSVAMDTGFDDTRLPIMVALVLFAGIVPVATPRLLGAAVAAGLLAVLAYRAGETATVWRAQASDIAALRAAIAPVEAGARVLAADVGQDSNPAYWAAAPANRVLPGYMRLNSHLPALLLVEHRAFWPLLFTAHDKQPLTVRPPYDRISAEQGLIPELGELSGRGGVRPGNDTRYLADWQRDFDYVLLLDPLAAGDPAKVLPDRLTLLDSNAVAALYRVRRPAASTAADAPPAPASPPPPPP